MSTAPKLASVGNLHGEYRPRRPDKTVLYKTVQQHMNTVFTDFEMRGKYLPEYVQEEFSAFLGCGILAKGFLRLYCLNCKMNKIVPFSCKGRGICPSCGGRRMCDTAAHLVDNVFPEVAVRQWVISFPFNLRYLFAYNKKALSKALEVTTRTINRFYLNHAKSMGVAQGKTGSVTLIQRFGSALNLNVHFHILYPDGFWDEGKKFHKVRPPATKDIQEMVKKLRIRVLRALEKRGDIEGFQINAEEDEMSQSFPGMAESLSSSIQLKNNQGKRIDKLGQYFHVSWRPQAGERCAYDEGFSLHANTSIRAHDREKLENICRYIARPALSNQRLDSDDKGNVILKLKRPFNDGSTHLRFTPTEFIEKLIALVPPPRVNLTRYHGALGPNSAIRKRIVKRNKKKKKEKAAKYRIAWAKLLKRVFEFEVLQCPCGGNLKLLSAVLDSESILKILESLEIPTDIPLSAPARGSPAFDFIS